MKNYGFVRCAIATFNGKLGDPAANGEKIRSLITEAEKEKTSILVLPELCLTGYTCQDLLETTHIMEESLYQLNQIRIFTSGKSILVLIGMPLNVNDTKYNCAVAIYDGRILGVVPKRYIPNHDEFYEKRWFSPYVDFDCTEIELLGKTVPFGNLIFSSESLGYRLGVEICEDLWAVIPPSSELALAGANILANLSASNELVGKSEYRRELVRSQSAKTISAYLYTSAGFSESTADLVFGGSGYAYENGKLIKEIDCFNTSSSVSMEIFDIDVEYLTNERDRNKTFSDSKSYAKVSNVRSIPVELKSSNSGYICPKFNDVDKGFYLKRSVDTHPFNNTYNAYKEILRIQTTALARRLDALNCKTVTIGVSGGLDSTLALLVCFDAFMELCLPSEGIIAITMPGFGTTDRTYNNCVKLCEQLGVTLMTIPIKDVCMQSFKDLNHDPEIHDITYENVQARARTSILMNIANKTGGIVIGTGDLSELMLGWCTYNGDHMSMYNVNCSIPKTLVKRIIEYYATENCNDLIFDILQTPISPELLPSDGKNIVQETESTVGPYELIDFFIYYFLRNRFDARKTVFLACHAFGYQYSKEEIIKYYNNFIKRVFNNQFKRDCVPNGPKVGTIGISPRGDLRMPSDADYTSWLYRE